MSAFFSFFFCFQQFFCIWRPQKKAKEEYSLEKKIRKKKKDMAKFSREKKKLGNLLFFPHYD